MGGRQDSMERKKRGARMSAPPPRQTNADRLRSLATIVTLIGRMPATPENRGAHETARSIVTRELSMIEEETARAERNETP